MDLMQDKNIKKWPIRLKVRTFGFHPKNLGALPGWATNKGLLVKWLSYLPVTQE